MTGAKLRLLLAAVLFFGWIGWLGYAAATKSRAPVVSQAQVAAVSGGAGAAVVAEVATGADGRPAADVTVVEPLTAGGPPAGTAIEVANLLHASGFGDAGKYLLLLTRDSVGTYRVAGQQRSPGYELADSGPPVIYPWSPGVEAQARNIFPAGK